MRLRHQHRVRKLLRRMHRKDSILFLAVAKLERQHIPLLEALRAAMLNPSLGHFTRAEAAKLLSLDGSDISVQALLKLFFVQEEKVALYSTALTIESLNDRRAIPQLIHALQIDNNPHRKHAATRALGWIHPSDRKTALTLARCLVDPSQPQPARQEAAESLAYVGTRETMEPLISALSDPDPQIRFWAVFGLGRSCRADLRAIRALESVLDDTATPPGNWWSVGKEALAMLASERQAVNPYHERLMNERERILGDPNATREDHNWAEFYDISKTGVDEDKLESGP